MTFSLGIVGAGQFSGQFAKLFLAHPGVSDVYVTDLLPERAEQLAAAEGLTGTFPSYEAMLESASVDAVAIFTQRWTHGPLVVQGLNAGKHVYSAVPMAVTTEEIAAIIDAVRATGLTYMMGETSQYNPATVHARNQIAEGSFGRIFYAEGDYVHDMDLGFYEAYQYSGGENWKATASYPPLLYPTRTRKQLADALRKREIPEDVAEEVLSRFEEVGLINDSAFADAWVESRHHGRGLARRALARELRTKGVDSALIDEAVGRLDSEQEEATARELVARKLRATRGLDRDKRIRRLAGMLARKGYSEGMALRVVRQALEEEGEDTQEWGDDGF